jgi:hypothetical protein
MAPALPGCGARALTRIKAGAGSVALDLGQGRGGMACPHWRHPEPSPTGATVKDENLTPKLIFALAVFAAVTFAVWSGMATSVEAPAQVGPHATGMLTPF